MKKIIYSLVIMIAAGSLFTSCVTNTEPQGIKDIREAKANYLDALANLRAADAEKVKAEATLVQAQAATEQAKAALKQAKAKAAEIQNEYAAEHNAIELAKQQAEAEAIIKEAEERLVAAETRLAWAEETLRQALVDIALGANNLTAGEQKAISDYTTAYNTLIAKQAAVRSAEENLYNATYEPTGEESVEVAKAGYEATVAVYSALAAQNQALYDSWAEVKEDEVGRYEVWAAEYEKLQDSLTGYQYLAADLDKEQRVYGVENREAFESFYASIEKQQDAVADAVSKATFSFSHEYDLPADTLDVVKVFKANIGKIRPTGIVTSPSADKMKVSGPSSDVKTAIYGSEAKPDSSLAGIIDALKRDSVVTDQLVKDTAGLAAAVAKIDSTYKAVKDTLEDGIAEWRGIKDALAKAAAAAGKPAVARAQYTQDTAALFKSISDFIKIWNDIAGTGNHELEYVPTGRYPHNDSLDIFNALKSIMVNRTKVFGEDTKFTFWYNSRGNVRTKDSVDFANIDFADLRNGVYNFQALGTTDRDGFLTLLNEAFGTTNPVGLFDAKMRVVGSKLYIDPITVQNIKGTGSPAAGSVLFQNLFFGKWWVSDKDNVFGEIYKKGGNTTKYANEYKAYKDARTDSINTANAVNTAKDTYYEDFYCKFWGIAFTTVYDRSNHKLYNPSDSLKINYTEKTYTDPYLIPVFEFQAGAFNPAVGSASANFDSTKVNLIPTLELETVEGFVGKNIKNKDGKYTLYAEKLYAEKFEKVAKTWKENTKALAELEAVVEKVKADYTAKVNSVAAAQTAADSVVTAVLGEDIVKKALKDRGKKHATDLWDATLRGDYFVNYTSGSRNIGQFCKNGKFTFGGQQLAAAEAYIPDYAAKVNEWATEAVDMSIAIQNCTDLAQIVKDYVDAIRNIEQYPAAGDPVAQVDSVAAYYQTMLGRLNSTITTCKNQVALAEGSLARLEAGYDPAQVRIENAKDWLAIVQKELEQAEVEFARAKAAYEQVLANHGLAE